MFPGIHGVTWWQQVSRDFHVSSVDDDSFSGGISLVLKITTRLHSDRRLIVKWNSEDTTTRAFNVPLSPQLLLLLPSFDSAGHSRTLEVRPGRINKKLEIHYDYDVKGMILNYYSESQMYDLVLLGGRLDTVWSDTTVWSCHLIGSRYDNINNIIPGVLVIGSMIWCFVVVLLFVVHNV